MKPVFQTRFGNPEGNCIEAVIASLLDLDLADVPELRECAERGGPKSATVNETIDGFLAARGWARVVVRLDARPWPWFAPGLLVAAGGVGPRGHGHECIYRATPGGFDLVHDPHPDGGGLVEVEDVWIFAPLEAGSRSAAEQALDEIAAISGCAYWEYPGQVVRDVRGLADNLFAALLKRIGELEAHAIALGAIVDDDKGESAPSKVAAISVIAGQLQAFSAVRAFLERIRIEAGKADAASAAKRDAAGCQEMYAEAADLLQSMVQPADRPDDRS